MKRLLYLLLALPFLAWSNSRDFADTTADYLDKAATCDTITSAPASLGIWFNADDATASDDLISLGDGSNASLNILSLRSNSATGFLAARAGDGTAPTDATTSGAHTTATWETGLATFTSAASRAAYLNGANKGTAGTTRTPSGIDNTVIGTDQIHGANSFDGRLAHASIWNKALSDLEAGYFGTGGNPRAISGLTCYYKISVASPEVDSLGGGSLTVHGTTSSASNPTIATWFTGSNYSNQTWTQNSAISSLTVDARFDDVSSAFTTSWKVLGTPASDTTASGAGSSSVELTVASATNLAAGDYIKIAAGGSPTLVLYKSGSTLLLATARTWSNSDTVYEFPVNSASITGVSLSAGSLSGTPTGSQAQTDSYFFRATNNATASLIADSNLFSITINATGGFSVNPSVTSQTTNAYTIGGTGTATVSTVACKKDTTPPPIVNVVAGNCASGAAEAAASDVWSGADSVTLGGSLTLPIYDLYVTDGTTLIALPDELLDAPAGKQYALLSSISSTSWVQDFNDVATPDAAVGDVIKIDSVTTPASFAWTQSTDGNGVYSGDASRQSLQYDIYDSSAGDYMSGGPGTLWFNNQTPVPPPPDSLVFRWTRNAAITPIDLTSYCPDPESDGVTVSAVSGLATGLSINGSNILSGTPTVAGISTLVLRCTDITGASVDWQ